MIWTTAFLFLSKAVLVTINAAGEAVPELFFLSAILPPRLPLDDLDGEPHPARAAGCDACPDGEPGPREGREPPLRVIHPVEAVTGRPTRDLQGRMCIGYAESTGGGERRPSCVALVTGA